VDGEIGQPQVEQLLVRQIRPIGRHGRACHSPKSYELMVGFGECR
jgi:hypothetical protein